VTLRGWNWNTSIAAMVNCGATTLFIGERFVKENNICMHLLVCEIPLYNIDRSKNQAGRIICFTWLQLQIGESIKWHGFLVMELGPKDVVLGLLWLRSVNPEIDWTKGIIKLNLEPKGRQQANAEQVVANWVQWRCWWQDRILKDSLERLWCTARYIYLTELA